MGGNDHLTCDACGTVVAARHQSYLDSVPQAREIVRSMLTGTKEGDGSVLAIANDEGIVHCPNCGTAVGQYGEQGASDEGRGGAPVAAELERLAALRERGMLTEDEFAAAKQQVLEG